MKNFTKVGIVAPFIFATGFANAASIDFGVLGAGDGFNHIQSYGPSVMSFDDDYYFQLGNLQNLDGLLANWSLIHRGLEIVGSDNMVVDFAIFNTFTSAWDSLQSWNVASGDVIDYNQNLGAGSYRLDIMGDVTGSNGSSYTITAAVSAVSEPSTYALMLGGLGLVGFMAARRRKQA